MLLPSYNLKRNIAGYNREITGVLFGYIRMKSLLSPSKVRIKSLLNIDLYQIWYQGGPILV